MQLNLIILFVFLMLFLTKNKFLTNQTENFKNQVIEKPDDLFTDGLDHNMGLNKKHRHHSF